MIEEPKKANGNQQLLILMIGVVFVVVLCAIAVAIVQSQAKKDAAVNAQKTAYAKLTQEYQPPVFAPLGTATTLPPVALKPTITIAPTNTVVVISLPTMPISTMIVAPNTEPRISAACSCGGDTLNCDNFSSYGSAQACFDYCQSQGRGDIHNLDADGNGLACESLR